MNNVELRGNKKLVVLKLLEEGDKTIYDIREMKLVNRNTKKRISTTGVNKLIKKLKEMGVVEILPSERGEKISLKKENVICKRSTEALKPDLVFMIFLMFLYMGIYWLFFKELLFVIGALSVFVFMSIYMVAKALLITEKKDVYAKKLSQNQGLNQGSVREKP